MILIGEEFDINSNRFNALINYFKEVKLSSRNQLHTYRLGKYKSNECLEITNLLKIEKALSGHDLFLWDRDHKLNKPDYSEGKDNRYFHSDLLRKLIHSLPNDWVDSYGRNVIHQCISHGLTSELPEILSIYSREPIANSKDFFGRTPMDLINYYDLKDRIQSDISLSGWQISSIWGYARNLSESELLEEITNFSIQRPNLSKRVNWPLFAYLINKTNLVFNLIKNGYSHKIIDWEQSSLIEKIFDNHDSDALCLLSQSLNSFADSLEFLYSGFLLPIEGATRLENNEKVLLDLLEFTYQSVGIEKREDLLSCLYILSAKFSLRNLYRRCVQLNLPPQKPLFFGGHKINCPLVLSLESDLFKENSKSVIKTFNDQPPEGKVNFFKALVRIHAHDSLYFDEVKSSLVGRLTSKSDLDVIKGRIEKFENNTKARLNRVLIYLKNQGMNFTFAKSLLDEKALRILSSRTEIQDVDLFIMDVLETRKILSKEAVFATQKLKKNLMPYTFGSDNLNDLSKGLWHSELYEALIQGDHNQAARLLQNGSDPTTLIDYGNNYPARVILDSNNQQLKSELLLTANSLPFNRWVMIADESAIRKRLMNRDFFTTKYHKFISLHGALMNLAIIGDTEKFIFLFEELNKMKFDFKFQFMHFVQSELVSIADIFGREKIREFVLSSADMAELGSSFYPETRNLREGEVFVLNHRDYLPLSLATWKKLRIKNRNLDFLAYLESKQAYDYKENP